MATNFDIDLRDNQNNFDIDLNDQVESFVVEFGETTWVTNNDFNKLTNRPSYNGTVMTGDTNIPVSPTATSQLTNDSNFQNANDVANAISTHNQSTSAHQDIRQAISDEATARYNADNSLQGQIDAITSASDVVDIVGTYAELQAYDTQHLKDNDVIKVLQDETHNDAMTYYRWSTDTNTWTYVGAEGPYYTKSETNTLLDAKLDANEVPDGFFDGPATITPTSSTSVEIEGGLKLKSIDLLGDTTQQTYSGKNLWGGYSNYTRTNQSVEFHTNSDGSITAKGIASASAYSILGSAIISNNVYITLGAGDYYLSTFKPLPEGVSIQVINESGTQIKSDEGSFTLSGTSTVACRLAVASGTDIDNGITVIPMITSGTTVSDFEPYVGGTASPNPSYPQTVNVVTGTQTITVTDGDDAIDTYTVNLGAIELAKIGEHQDYIYKSGDDWYVHKETGKYTFTGTENWSSASYGTNSWYKDHLFTVSDYDASKVVLACDFSQGIPYNDRPNHDNPPICVCYWYTSNERFLVRNTSIVSQADMQSATAGKNVYYWATPTDTQITDSSLISQLNAVLNATLYQPNTTITSSGNLPAILKLEVYTEHLNSLLEIASEPMPTPVTYSDFVGTDGVTAGTAGLVPAPAVTDVDKFLKSDGTWDTAGGGSSVTVVQTTGTSQTDVMSQNAVSSMVFADPGTNTKIKIGSGASVSAQNYNMAIGYNANANGLSAVAIGYGSGARANSTAIGAQAQAGTATAHNSSVAIGYNAQAKALGAIAIGRDSSATSQGEINIGSSNTSYGYNSTNYRLLTGVHDPVNAHDAATKGYVDSAAGPFHTITSDDFNYDSDEDSTNDSVALWLLPTGFYLFSDTPEFQLWAYIDEDDNPVDVTMGIYIIQNNGPGDVVSIALVGAERMEPIVVEYDTGKGA